MKTEKEIKDLVKDKYGSIAREVNGEGCGPCGCSTDYSFVGESYDKLEGYNPDADLNLGCGLPTELAGIKEGDTVVDLGSGAGNDVFIARREVGPTGTVIGVDMTEDMIDKARENNAKLGYDNVQFRFGEIDDIPISENTADVVVSNCVFNLVPNKQRAFDETFRILKVGGHFSISDIVVNGDLPDKLKEAGELYVGCVSGAISKQSYLDLIEQAGFDSITITKERRIELPEDLLNQFMTDSEIDAFHKSEVGIFSITVKATKSKDCCSGSCC